MKLLKCFLATWLPENKDDSETEFSQVLIKGIRVNCPLLTTPLFHPSWKHFWGFSIQKTFFFHGKKGKWVNCPPPFIVSKNCRKGGGELTRIHLMPYPSWNRCGGRPGRSCKTGVWGLAKKKVRSVKLGFGVVVWDLVFCF